MRTNSTFLFLSTGVVPSCPLALPTLGHKRCLCTLLVLWQTLRSTLPWWALSRILPTYSHVMVPLTCAMQLKVFALWGTGNRDVEITRDAWILDVNSITWNRVIMHACILIVLVSNYHPLTFILSFTSACDRLNCLQLWVSVVYAFLLVVIIAAQQKLNQWFLEDQLVLSQCMVVIRLTNFKLAPPCFIQVHACNKLMANINLINLPQVKENIFCAGVRSLYHSCVEYVAERTEFNDLLLQRMLPLHIQNDISEERDRGTNIVHYEYRVTRL